jgi:hypothetical protein
MPRPSTPQPRNRSDGQPAGAAASRTSPAARARLEIASTPRPPCRSITRPTQGPSSAVSSTEAEKAAKTALGGRAKSRAIGPARIADR